ncbi:MAG: DegT/DnrJ/EryC1/StrS family aminotransferase [Deltaproteobacteria bacterium]|nr:DegT/DnrJ/EryC1/StrS family aminotransferase [Deltaproteobacteria bacterium]MDQ3295282.1 beta-eliminating lyase-related protein [Myxococcota bacterium]
MTPVDLRSDTVTRPTGAMRAVMATAEVGDDVYGEDPNVRTLEERVADLLGTEAALFVPSGTMANQIALRAHTKPGDEILISRDAHCWRHESGALAAIAGVQTQMLPGHTFTAAEVRAAFRPEDPYQSPSRVVTVENTHNMGGGICWEPAALTEVTAVAKQLGLLAHLDGARLWNAAVATQTSEKELARGFDSVAVCLSKGLGAPVGSLVAGSRDFIRRCHRFRKMHGGGMRQAGILAAAGIHALDHHRARLADDHANARALGEALVGAWAITVDLARIHTNIVMIDLERGTAAAVVAKARDEGILLGVACAQRVRAVTHLDVDREGVLRAAKVIAGIAAAM